MGVPECDNCGRELDSWDAEEGICVCGAPIPVEVIALIEKASQSSLDSALSGE